MYERPEILEVGQAEILTLGTSGDCPDKCDCSLSGDGEVPKLPQFGL